MGIIDPTQKEIIEEQKAFLKGKSFKYKFEYFMDYYFKFTLAIIAIIVVVILLIRTYVNRKPAGLYAVFINGVNSPLEQEFADYSGMDTSKERVAYDTTMFIDLNNQSQSVLVSSQKLFALVSAGDADVILGDQIVMEAYSTSSFYSDLRDLYTEEELNALGDKVVWGYLFDANGDATGEMAPLFIDVTDSIVLNANDCFYPITIYLSFSANSKHVERSKQFVDYLFEYEYPGLETEDGGL